MSFSANPLFSQKKGTVFNFIVFIAVALFLVGVLVVIAGPYTRTTTLLPGWAGVSLNQSYNFTISNGVGNTAIDRVEITKPTSYTAILCLTTPPVGWSCSNLSSDIVRFSTGTIDGGASQSFNVTATPGGSAGSVLFTVETKAGTDLNTTTHSTGVDTLPPKIDLMNVSDGTRILSSGGHLDGTLYLSNSTGSVVILYNSTDNESGVNILRFYYNASNFSDTAILKAEQNFSNTYDTSIIMSNGSFGPGTLWNVTLNDGNLLLNGTRIVFTVVANDTARNGNISNYTSPNSERVFNFTIDSAVPRFEDVSILNFSQVVNSSAGSGVIGINTTKMFGSAVEYILNSTLLLNVSAIVSDGGGSGVVKVELMNRSGTFTILDGLPINGANGSAGKTTWNFSLYNITDLAQRLGGFNGDGLYNLSFRVTDNVSNVVNSNFTVEVDDTPPTGSVSTQNLTFAGKLSQGNVTLNASNPIDKSSNLTFIVRLQTSSNIDNVTRNVSVFGNLGLIHNLSIESGTASGTAVWNLSIGLVNTTPVPANTFNLSEFCAITDTDGSTCNLRFNFSDVLGRFNDTLNLTVAVDLLTPNVSIVSPVSLTTNYSGSVLINASVNDSVGPLSNVSFRWRNSTSGGYEADSANVSNWMPMTLNAGSNSQFSAQGYWTATLTISSLVDGNYTIEINATDSGGRQNATSNNVTNVIFDSTPPQNITAISPASNSFSGIQFNITVNASDRVSGLKNVSFRLENNSFNWPWVEATSAIAGISFNASRWNLTHFGGEATNATNGNFTVRFNVTDTSGNQNTSIIVNLTIDTVAPGVSFVNLFNNINKSGNFTINVSVTESNVASVWFRWVNDSSGTTAGHRSPWTTMTGGTANTFNGTFINLTVAPTLADGNFSIEVNVTDSAGNQNATTFVTLILDNNAPVIVAKGSNTTNLVADINFTTNFVVNLTINDTSTWSVNPLGKIATTNINGSAFRLENATFNSSWVGMDFATRDLTSTESNRTNASFTFSSVPNGLYNIRFMVNDTAGNQNNTVQISRVMLDNVAPGVIFTTSNISPVPPGGGGLSGTITFNASITDNLPLNISITNDTPVQGNKFGVFYRFESASVTTSWLPISAANPAGFPTTLSPHDVMFNGTNITTTLANGDYRLRINATDSAGNQNTSVYVDVTVQNGGTGAIVTNHTILDGFFNDNLLNQSSPVFLVNTSVNATCKYALDKPALTTWSLFGNTRNMSNRLSKEHNVALGGLADKASYTLRYVCQATDLVNYTSPNDGSVGAATTLQFGVDTRGLWNVTIPGKTDNNWPNYFQPAAGGSSNGWSSFVLATGALEQTTLSNPGTYNVTNVLASLMSGTAAGNYTRIYAYTASTNSWETFEVGRISNNFINFTNQTTYWINVTAVERLEIN